MSQVLPLPTEEIVAAGGGPSALARQLGIKPQGVSQWRRVPSERVLEVERITGFSRYQIRPDIYGEDPSDLSSPDGPHTVAAGSAVPPAQARHSLSGADA